MDKKLSLLLNEKEIFLRYLKEKYPVFHNSNVFFRDFHYGIKRFFEKKGIDVNYSEAEKLAKSFGDSLEKDGIFIKVNSIGWKLNYPDFTTVYEKVEA